MLQFLYRLCSYLNVNKCAFPETYLLKYQPSSFIVIAIVLLKISNSCLFHCWFWANFNSLSVLKLFRKWWCHQNVRHTMGFSYSVFYYVLHKCSFMLKHLKIGSSVLWRDFVQFFITKSSYRRAHFCLFPMINYCNPLAFQKNHRDLPIGMISDKCWLAE